MWTAAAVAVAGVPLMFPGQSQQSLPLSSLSALLFVSMDDDTGRLADRQTDRQAGEPAGPVLDGKCR